MRTEQSEAKDKGGARELDGVSEWERERERGKEGGRRDETRGGHAVNDSE